MGDALLDAAMGKCAQRIPVLRTCDHLQQRIRILAAIHRQCSDGRLITGHLHVFDHAAICDVHQRIHPVNTEDGICGQLDPQVPPADMDLFMCQHTFLHRCVHPVWQIDARAKQADRKRSAGYLCLIHIFMQMTRIPQLSAQTDRTQSVPRQQSERTRCPEGCGDLLQIRRPHLFCGCRILHLDHIRRLLWCGRYKNLLFCLLHLSAFDDRRRRHGRKIGTYAEITDQIDRQDQREKCDHPKQVGKTLR